MRTSPWRTSLARRTSPAPWCHWSCATARRCRRSAAQAVLEAATRLGYRPNAMARGLASRRTMTIGVLLNDLHNPFFADIAYAIEEAAAAVGYRLLIITGGRHQRREQAMLDALLEYRTDGLILVSPHLPAASIAAAAEHSPLIVLGRQMRQSTLDWVMTDEAVGAHLAVEHLVRARAFADRPHRRRPRRGRPAAPRGLSEGDGGVRPRAVARWSPGEFTEAAGIAGVERCSRPRPAPDRDLRRQRPRRRGRAGPRRGRGPARPRGHLDRRLRQHLPGRAAPHVADVGRPAAGGDGPPGLRAAAGAHRGPHGARRPAARAGSGRPQDLRPRAEGQAPQVLRRDLRQRADVCSSYRRQATPPDDLTRPPTSACGRASTRRRRWRGTRQAITGEPDRFTADDRARDTRPLAAADHRGATSRTA